MRVLLAAVAGMLVCAAGTVAATAPEPTARVLTGSQPFGAVELNGTLWVTVVSAGQLVGIDPDRNRIVARVKTGASPFAVAAGAGSLWTANAAAGTVSRIDPKRRRVVKTIKVGRRPYDIAF